MDASHPLPLPPGPRPFSGFAEFRQDPPGHLALLIRRYGDVVRWRGLMTIHVLNQPEDIKRVLAQAHPAFTKRTIDYRVLAQVMGNGLVSNDGPDWERQRKLIQPLFHARIVNAFDTSINALTAALVARWEQAPPETVMLDHVLSKLTFEIVGATLFGTDIERYADEVADILEVVNLHTQDPRALLTLLPWLPTRHNRRFKVAKRRLDEIVHGLVDARRASGPGKGDLLDRLIAARYDGNGTGMSDTQLRDELVTLMLAGHETSAMALVWTIHLLAQHPDCEAKLLDELDRELGEKPATSADLARLPYLKQVVQESMRIYPPVWAIARRQTNEEVYGGYRVPAGAYLVIVPYALHRDPKHWPDPERFDPERFAPGREEARAPYTYLPFAAGPRTCIGMGMAMLETELVLAQLLPRFRFRPMPGAEVVPVARVTLKPRDGMAMRVERR
ncbi:MAG: cytochrome P450 [Gammaproteobacteria bacterium]|nr:cytochrome P450 [Gammaproteobacteria bacterium]MBI5616398.1 cytochrome P450 [Gammaproteobacteria bacterium]